MDAKVRFRSCAEFYPFYLSEHSNRVSRRLHFAGTTVALACILSSILLRQPWGLVPALIAGYGFAWVGHFFFEKNRPATFSHPWYSLAGDWVMWKDMIIGRIPL